MYNYIKKNRKLYALAKVILAKKTDTLIDIILNDKKEQFYFSILSKGKNNQDKVIYWIKRRDKNEGFFAMIRTTLYHLAVAERFNFTPYILWSEECSYYQEGGYKDRINPFEYYFRQPFDLSNEEVENSYNIVEASERDLKIMSDFSLDTPYYYTDSFINCMASLMRKYIAIQDDVKRMLKKDLEILNLNGNILGVHYRGTDFKVNYNAHPKCLLPEEYFEKIDHTLAKYSIEKIFLATDDENALNIFKMKYGNRIIYYEDTKRAEGNQSVMHATDCRGNNNFLKGYEVIRDVYTLSFLKGIISGVSMVAIFARIWKRARNETYEIDTFIDNGINNNSKKYITGK